MSFSAKSGSRVIWRRQSLPATELKLPLKLTTAAYESHKFARRVQISRAFCQMCDMRVTFSLRECTACKLSGHKECMMKTYIKCGPQYFLSNPFDIPMFGTYLTELLEDLPVLVYKSVVELEARNPIKIQFIYNAKGDEEEVAKLVKAFNFAPKSVDLSEVAYYDIGHLVKKFFIELKNPVITSKPRRAMMDIIRMLSDDGIKKLDLCDRDLVKRAIKVKMVNAHRVTLNYFILHLKRISEKFHDIQMGVSDLADIFGPILCGRGEMYLRNDADAIEDKKLVKALIYNAYNLFDVKEAETPYGARSEIYIKHLKLRIMDKKS